MLLLMYIYLCMLEHSRQGHYLMICFKDWSSLWFIIDPVFMFLFFYTYIQYCFIAEPLYLLKLYLREKMERVRSWNHQKDPSGLNMWVPKDTLFFSLLFFSSNHQSFAMILFRNCVTFLVDIVIYSCWRKYYEIPEFTSNVVFQLLNPKTTSPTFCPLYLTKTRSPVIFSQFQNERQREVKK